MIISAPASAREDLLLGRGVNVELWGAFEQQGTPADRIDRARAAGFDFVRIGVSITPWLQDVMNRLGYPVPAWMQGKGDSLRSKTVEDMAEAIDRGLANGMRVLVALFVISPEGGLTGGRTICDLPEGRGSYVNALRDILIRIPDSANVAIEPLNEPPGGCTLAGYGTSSGEMWASFQRSLYEIVRSQKSHAIFVVSAGDFEQVNGLLLFDPSQYASDENSVFAVHYYEPTLFTLQGRNLSGANLESARYVSGVTWPVDSATLGPARDASLAAISAAVESAADAEKVKRAISDQFDLYEAQGTEAYLETRFQQLADWATSHRISTDRILIGEFGVSRPSGGTRGDPREGSASYLGAVRKAADSRRFSWSVWDLDGSMAILCGIPPQERVCSAYRTILGPTSK